MALLKREAILVQRKAYYSYGENSVSDGEKLIREGYYL